MEKNYQLQPREVKTELINLAIFKLSVEVNCSANNFANIKHINIHI